MSYEQEIRELKDGLAQCIGTGQYYKYPLSNVVYTDGVKFLMDKGQCVWLITDIMSYQIKHNVKDVPFQLWTLKVSKIGKTAILTMKEDSDTPVIIEKKYNYTDFPLDEMTFYLANKVLYLPPEH